MRHKELIKEKADFLLMFSASWCQACQMIKPTIEEKSKKKNIELVIIDVEQYPSIATEYDAMSLPTIIIFSKGEPQIAIPGNNIEKFNKNMDIYYGK